MSNKIELESWQIISLLDRLHIKRESQPNSKGWLSIACPNPYHTERVHDNCSINLHSGIIKCFSCQYKKSIIGYIKENTDYKTLDQIKQFIDNGMITEAVKKSIPIQVQEVKKSKNISELLCVDFSPEEYLYTRQRGFTKEYCKKFGIKLCFNAKYSDYFVIPVKDEEKNIDTFEARKLQQHETLEKYFETNADNEILKKYFQEFVDNHSIEYTKGILYKEGKPYNDIMLQYLMKPKVLYPSNSGVQETIFNRENLNIEEDLVLVEGAGSHPRIYTEVTENSSCIFGVSLTPAQIEILKQFKRIIYIPDFDLAGFNSVIKMMESGMKNFLVKDVRIEDTDKDYTNIVRRTRPIQPSEYVYKNLKIFHKGTT